MAVTGELVIFLGCLYDEIRVQRGEGVETLSNRRYY